MLCMQNYLHLLLFTGAMGLTSPALALDASCDLNLKIMFKMTSPTSARLSSDQTRGTVEISLQKDLPSLSQELEKNDMLKNITAEIAAKEQTLSINETDDAGKLTTTTVPAEVSADFSTSKGGKIHVTAKNAEKLFASALKKLAEDTRKIDAHVVLTPSALDCAKANADLTCSMKITGTAHKPGAGMPASR